jgi:hypothetical protein
MTNTPQNPPPGYYPDQKGVQRYWDGNAWTEQTDQFATAMPTATPAARPAGVKTGDERPWFKKKRYWIPGVLVALLIVGSAVGSGGGSTDKKDEPVASATSDQSSDATDADVKTEKPKPTKTTKEAPKLTSGQENALAAAENYLSIAAFSRNGLIRQSSSDAADGYSKADATYAADHVKVNYKEQAAKAAKNYLEISPFSRSGMIQQLTSDAGDGYTREQAEYGADKAGL